MLLKKDKDGGKFVDARGAFEKGYTAGYENAKDKLIPDLKFLLGVILEYLEGKKTDQEAAEEIKDRFGNSAAKAFIDTFIGASALAFFEESALDAAGKQAQMDLGAKLAKTAKEIISLTVKLAGGTISLDKYISGLGSTGFAKVMGDMGAAAGINIDPDFINMAFQAAGSEKVQAAVKNIGSRISVKSFVHPMAPASQTAAPGGMALPMASVAWMAVSAAAFTAAFGITSKYVKDAHLEREKRIEIEKERDEAVALIIADREKMNELMSQYLSENLSIFEKGFCDMDMAMVSGDQDGFIRANEQLQRCLGHEQQFSNQEEFDDLMMSDEAFKL